MKYEQSQSKIKITLIYSIKSYRLLEPRKEYCFIRRKKNCLESKIKTLCCNLISTLKGLELIILFIEVIN